MMSPPEEEETEFAQSSGNVDGKGGWWLEPMVWGPKWLIICFLMVTIFNHKWADIKYYQFDSRDHFGFGAWTTCSKLFEENATWAPAPESAAACTAHWASCGGENWSKACAVSGYSDVKGQEASYWAVMEDCVGVCSMQDWLQLCLDSPCGGSLHATQCRNVSEEATRPYTLEYVTGGGRPWVGGEHCRSDVLCDNDLDLMHTGNLAVAGFFFICLAQLLFFVRGLAPKACEQIMLIAVLAVDILAWVLLLASWANFVSLRGADTECIVAVPGDHGYAKAIGTFDDVINTGGGYTFYMTVGAWVLLIVPISLIIHKLFLHMMWDSEGKGDAQVLIK